MHPISAQQIRAARAMLNWSQETLAEESKLCVATIRNIEKGSLSPRSALDIRKALEDAGLEFFENNGLGYRKGTTKIYESADAIDVFHNDLIETVKKSSGIVSVVSRSQDLFMQSLGITSPAHFGRLKEVCKFSKIQCLLSDAQNTSQLDMPVQFRVLPKNYTGNSSYFAYGNKYVIALREDGSTFRYIVFQSASQVQSFLTDFSPLWNSAVPLSAQTNSAKRRA